MAKPKPVINALDAVRDIRGGMDDAGLMKKYNISFKGLQSLFRKLVAAGGLDQAEIEERKKRITDDSVIIDVGELLLQEKEGRAGIRPKTLEKSVLVVSGDRSFLDTVSNYLAMHELHVVKCEDDSPDAQLLRQVKPDLVLGDISFVGADRLIELSRQCERQIPIILAADSWNRQKAGEGVDQGAYDFVEKPVDAKAAMRTIRRALEYAGLLLLKRDHLERIEEQVNEKTLEIVRTKDFLKGILDSSTLVSVVLTDLSENTIFWNKGAENIFGYTPDEMIGTKIARLFPLDRLSQETIAELRKVLDVGTGTAYGKMNHVAKDGTVLTISLAMSPMKDAMGEVLGILWMGLDVTEEMRQNKEIMKLLHEVRKTQDVAIFALAKLAESRGEETGAHLSRIQAYCRVLCYRLSRREKFKELMTGKFIDDLVRSSVLHDIGMVALPDSILWSPHRLHPKERELMNQHPIVGGKALEQAVQKLGEKSFLSVGMEVAYSHHECWDGSGYPFGLAEEGIPLSARIVALADAYEELTTEKGTKAALAHEEACARIKEGSGTLFDPELVDVFLTVESDFAKIRETVSED